MADGNSNPLHQTASAGDVQAVRDLLDGGADKDAKNERGRTALIRACENGHVAVAQALLEAGADRGASDDVFSTALRVAARAGYAATAQALLGSGGSAARASVEAKNWRGQTPLHVAARAGRVPATKALLAAGADKDARSHNGHTPLHLACRRGHDACAQVRLEAGADMDAMCDAHGTALHEASASGHGACAQRLLEAGAKVNTGNGNTPLINAVVGGHWETARTLLEGGADVHHRALHPPGATALHLACRYVRMRCVGELLQWGADPMAQEDDPDNDGLDRRPIHLIGLMQHQPEARGGVNREQDEAEGARLSLPAHENMLIQNHFTGMENSMRLGSAHVQQRNAIRHALRAEARWWRRRALVLFKAHLSATGRGVWGLRACTGGPGRCCGDGARWARHRAW